MTDKKKKPDKPKKDYLKLWGFHENPKGTTLDTMKLSEAQVIHLKKFIEDFPKTKGLVFVGHPRLVNEVSTQVLSEIFKAGKIKNIITLIDIPSELLQFSKSSFENRDSQESDLLRDLNNSDLVILQEIALAQWTEAQQARLYIMLNQRYSKGLPIICTVSCDIETFESHVGLSNFYRISDQCTFIELGHGK